MGPFNSVGFFSRHIPLTAARGGAQAVSWGCRGTLPPWGVARFWVEEGWWIGDRRRPPRQDEPRSSVASRRRSCRPWSRRCARGSRLRPPRHLATSRRESYSSGSPTGPKRSA